MTVRAALRLGLLAVAMAVAPAAGGCGDDEETERTSSDRAGTDAGDATERGEEAKPDDRSQPAPSSPYAPGGAGPPPAPSPEDEPGGVGDEEPARSLALLTGRGGRITPRLVRVPPYISIRVELRSADGRAYGLRFDGRVLRAGGAVSSVSTTLAGLRPGRAAVGKPLSGTNAVRIEATAEPGP